MGIQKRLKLFIGCVGFMLLLAGCGAQEETGPIKIGLLQSYTGPAGLFGEPTENAAQLAIDEINAAGGVLGRQLELVTGDDETNPQKANEVADRLVNQENVDIVIGMHSSASREAALPIIEAADKLYLYTPTYEGGACAENLFNLGEVPNQQIQAAIPYLMEEFGGTTWYLIGNDYVWPRTSNEAAEAIIEAAGGTVIGEVYVPLGTAEFSSEITQIQDADPDHILQTLVGGDGIAFQKQLFDFGVTEDTQVLTLLLEEFSGLALGEAAEGVRSVFAYFNNLETGNNSAFIDSYRAAYGDEAPPMTSLSESVYEAIQLFAIGAENAGSLETAELVQGMSDISYDGPRGPVTLSGTSRHLDQHIYLGEINASGQFEIINDFGVIESGENCN